VGNKHAKTRAQVRTSEPPKARPPAQTVLSDHPHFCFEHVDTSTKESYAFAPAGDGAAEILKFICEMARLSWGQIEQQETGPPKKRKRKHHSQEIDTVEKCAQKDLTRRKLASIFGDAPLFRFRVGGEKRLWGFRKGRVFHVLWWDTKHAVYKQEK